MLGVYVYRIGRVFELQTKNNGVDKVKAMIRKGFDGTKVLIKMVEVRFKHE